MVIGTALDNTCRASFFGWKIEQPSENIKYITRSNVGHKFGPIAPKLKGARGLMQFIERSCPSSTLLSSFISLLEMDIKPGNTTPLAN